MGQCQQCGLDVELAFHICEISDLVLRKPKQKVKATTNLETLIKEVLDLNEKASNGPWLRAQGYEIINLNTGLSLGFIPVPFNAELIAHYRTSAVKLAKVSKIVSNFLAWESKQFAKGTNEEVFKRIQEMKAEVEKILE